ncbi:hypothetical protein H0H92_012653 [Tricholoma furcatifolium]|nr:hypothetical protein H0H92_012653 [Tricholoma furcatifolium]
MADSLVLETRLNEERRAKHKEACRKYRESQAHRNSEMLREKARIRMRKAAQKHMKDSASRHPSSAETLKTATLKAVTIPLFEIPSTTRASPKMTTFPSCGVMPATASFRKRPTFPLPEVLPMARVAGHLRNRPSSTFPSCAGPPALVRQPSKTFRSPSKTPWLSSTFPSRSGPPALRQPSQMFPSPKKAPWPFNCTCTVLDSDEHLRHVRELQRSLPPSSPLPELSSDEE